MSVITIIVTVCILIFALWLVREFLPDPWKTPVLVFVVLIGLVWILTILFPSLASVRVG